MSNQDLVVLEKELADVEPQFAQVLQPVGVPAERIIRTMLVSCDRNTDLLICTRQSLMNAAMSAACLGLEVDGVTGQAFLIPFNDNRSGKKIAQLIVGYKGYNTIAARSGFTINSAVVREGDGFEYQLGSDGFVKHTPKLGNDGRIIGAWAVATSNKQPPIIPPPLSIQQLEAVKARSPGAKRRESPWNDLSIGFPAMCEKTAKRRLARYMPLNLMLMAAAMEEAFEERGLPARVDPQDGVVIEGDVISKRSEGDPNVERPRCIVIDATGKEHDLQTIERWQSEVSRIMQRFQSGKRAVEFRDRMAPVFEALRIAYPTNVKQTEQALADLIAGFKKEGTA